MHDKKQSKRYSDPSPSNWEVFLPHPFDPGRAKGISRPVEDEEILEDLQCPNKQEKRVDTTFAITTTITPDSATQDSGWETPSKRKDTSGASKFCSLKLLQATI